MFELIECESGISARLNIDRCKNDLGAVVISNLYSKYVRAGEFSHTKSAAEVLSDDDRCFKGLVRFVLISDEARDVGDGVVNVGVGFLYENDVIVVGYKFLCLLVCISATPEIDLQASDGVVVAVVV